MKTSRIARETAEVAASISHADFVPRRQTRSFAASLQQFTANGDLPANDVEENKLKLADDSDDELSASISPSASVFDIEDAPLRASVSRKRKRGLDTSSTEVTTVSESTSTRTSPRKPGAKIDDGAAGKVKKARRQPAKRIVNEAGEEEIQPPANWEEIYEAVEEMRKEKLAPVDTMGCETLAEDHRTPRVSSYLSPWPKLC